MCFHHWNFGELGNSKLLKWQLSRSFLWQNHKMSIASLKSKSYDIILNFEWSKWKWNCNVILLSSLVFKVYCHTKSTIYIIINIHRGLENCCTYTQTRQPRTSSQKQTNFPATCIAKGLWSRVAYNHFATYLTTKERLTIKQSSNKIIMVLYRNIFNSYTTDALLEGIDDKQ